MLDVIVILIVLAFVAGGFYAMDRLDRYLSGRGKGEDDS